MKMHVITCRLRTDRKYMVIVAESSGGKGMRQVVSDHPVPPGEDVEVQDDRVVG